MLQEEYCVKRAGGHPVEVCVPGSKSITNRALLIAALCNGTSVLHGVLFSDDSRHFIQALKELGFPVIVDEAKAVVTITGFGGKIPAAQPCQGAGDAGQGRAAAGTDEAQNQRCDASIDVGSAGTAARFLTAYLGLSAGRFHIDSSEQMKKRPMRELLEALGELGAVVRYDEVEYHFPFVIGNERAASHEVTVDVDKSSQFLSALLISAVLFEQDFIIHVTGNHGMAYVDMTVAMMAQFGVEVIREDAGTFRIPGGSQYCAMEYQIEPDVSAAAYFYAMCPVLGVSAKVQNVHWKCLQGDIRFLTVLEQMGCTAVEEADGILMLPPEDGVMRGGTFDLSTFSDQALTLAAIACFADTGVTITGIGHIRYQECDRIMAITHNLAAMGIDCTQKEGTVAIAHGTPHGCRIATFEDHRVAMAFALPGLVTDGIVIENPMCCKKTFEEYFDMLESCVC